MFASIKALLINFTITLMINDSNLQIISKKFDPYNLDESYRVKKVATPLEQKQIINALCKSHVLEFGQKPGVNRLAFSWAQVALENNRGKKVWNNNLGNQGPFRMDQEYYHHLRGGWPYRSFRTPEESGIAYWRVIRRCSMALRAFDDGDPITAAASLKRCNYYSSDPDQYSRVLKSLYYEAKAKHRQDLTCGRQEKDR